TLWEPIGNLLFLESIICSSLQLTMVKASYKLDKRGNWLLRPKWAHHKKLMLVMKQPMKYRE
ncbi:TPA: hypothetical protein ACIDD6_004414, partial [Shigella flexneri]|nr:hypothetical protein [Shigella flexneri]EAA1749961.1 hypothetical protein [Shigella flexneri]EGD7787355.1 hypothetical protein [Shigella flexneri]EGD8157407.1 hypothetical protein [Shigella flexneri]EGD8872566.1 hypothetical protein [Shigella flexneri]